MNLSKNQQDIVNHIDGALLVKAGPGSGKTRVLTERVKNLLSVKKRGKVLALTFSNMAAEEMLSRLEKDPEVEDSLERVSVSTIHSFCLDLLQTRGHLVGLRSDFALFESDTDRTAILKEVWLNEQEYLAELNKEQNPSALLARYMSAISESKRSLISPEMSEMQEPFPSIYGKYNDALFSQNALDFDDILFYAYRIFAENKDVAQLYNSVYRYVCVDESQDLNEAQYRVIQALCGSDFKNIMMVGDENQSIYAFNGSSSKYMSDYFVKDFQPTIYTLNENFRSAKQIIKYANSLNGNQEDVSQYFYDGEVSIKCFPNEAEEAKFVRETIETLIANGHKDIEGTVTYEKIAVIARNKYVFSNIENELNQLNIPYYVKQTRSGIACETKALEVFDLALRLIVNPLDIYHKQLLCKLTQKNISTIAESTNASDIIQKLLTGSDYYWMSSAFANLIPDIEVDFDNIIQALNNAIPIAMPDDEKYLVSKDIEEWNSHWKRFKARVPRENRSLVSFRNAIALGKTQSLEYDSGVALLTAHMSKGLEYEAVLIVGLTEGTFPDYRAVSSGGSAIEQEKNNMYVAATRAKRLCYLSYPLEKVMPWGGTKRQQPSRFIKDYKPDREI